MLHFLTFLKTFSHWVLAIATTKKAHEYLAKSRLPGRKPQSKRLWFIHPRHLCVKSCGQCVVCKIGQILSKPQAFCQSSKKPSSCLNGFERRSRFLSFCKSATSWIIERLDGKMAVVIGSNIVEKCDITLSRAINLLHPMFCASYFSSHISLSLIAHVLT